MTREELIDLVSKILRCEGSEDTIDQMQQALERQLIDPQLGDYMYWNMPEMTPEEIVDKALAFKPIVLPGPEGWPTSLS